MFNKYSKKKNIFLKNIYILIYIYNNFIFNEDKFIMLLP